MAAQEIEVLREEVKNLTEQVQALREELGAIRETMCLLSIPGMREKILEGGRTPIEECSEEIEW